MQTSPVQWQSAAVYYYDEDKDALILDCIQPLLQHLHSVVEQAFFVRHWLRGPHLRLRFLATENQFEEEIKPALEEQVGAYLRTHPSDTQLDAEKLLPTYERLALIEREEGPLLPLYPNNSIQYLPYDRRLHVLKGDLLASILEDFYVETNDLVYAMLEAVRQGQSRLTLCLDLLFTTAQMTIYPITTGFISFRSHADGFIMRSADPDTLRSFFEEKYRCQAHQLTSRLSSLLQALEQERSDFPFVLAWADLMKRYWTRSQPLLEAGVINLTLGRTDALEYDKGMKARLNHSTFHDHLYENSFMRQHLFHSVSFQGYRLALNLLYLHLTRLGIRPFERALLGHLAANTVEEVFNISAADLITWTPSGSLAS